MVHDPRVTQQLSRLGGLYRDPSRVDRDAATLLKSSVGNHLHPISAVMVENNGSTSTVLVLQGTIATHFRGNTYQLLIDMYLPAGYPRSPPVCFVRLAENMYLKEGHRHVGSDGKVYLPYLHEWSSSTHNLVELVVAMSSVFSADPPVFTRAATSNASSSSSTTTRPAAATTTATHQQQGTAYNNNDSSMQHEDSERWMAEQIEAVMAKEAREVAEAARQAEIKEKERARALEAQKAWEKARTDQVRQEVNSKCTAHVREQSKQCQKTIHADKRDQQRLHLAKEQKINYQLDLYKDKRKEIKKLIEATENRTVDIKKWLEAMKDYKDNNSKAAEAGHVDDMVHTDTIPHTQMLDLSAENQSISDALYFLDKALQSGQLTCEEHLRQVRRLAKRQFLVRAHLIKIHQVLVQP